MINNINFSVSTSDNLRQKAVFNLALKILIVSETEVD